ncbi:MAG: YicC/YloC family endoribonuclease [Candidatus Omnitrophota bacterium]
MIKSMTGFGMGEVKTKYGVFMAELRTLNHKFLEITPRLPNSLFVLEDRVKNVIKSKVKRGKIYLNLVHDTVQDAGGNIVIDAALAKSYYNKLNKLSKRLNIKDAVRLSEITSFPGVINYKVAHENTGALWPSVKESIEKALKSLIKDREKEGSFLFRDFMKRVGRIKGVVGDIKANAASNVKSYKKNLSQRIKELSGAYPVDRGRIEIEVALFAKNSDITEEITRLHNHIGNFTKTIRKSGEVGKKLDFICQELHREINTVGSKSSGYNISKGVIEIKTEIEKIREQLKNIE